MGNINDFVINFPSDVSLYGYKKPAIILGSQSSVQKRLDISKIFRSDKNSFEINKELEKFDVFFKKYKKDSKYTSSDFAFESIGMSEYKNDKLKNNLNNLLKEDLTSIETSNYPEIGNIVAYTGSENLSKENPFVNHWGIITEINDKIIVESKWKNNIYSHPLECVPVSFGPCVYFFQKY